MSKRAILYARVSTTFQADNYSLSTQLEACQKYADQQGFTVVGQFADTVSGTTLARPGLEQARAMIKQGQADVLIIYSIDRFSRNVADFHLLQDELKQSGIEWHVTTRGRVKDTPEGHLHNNIEVSFADYERRRILERFDRGRRGKVTHKKVLGNGIRPYGYNFVQERGKHNQLVTVGLEVVEKEAEIIRMIFDWYLRGDGNGPVSVVEITRRLKQMRVPSYADVTGAKYMKERKVGDWSRGSVYHILGNRLYMGEARYTLKPENDEAEAQQVSVPVPIIIDPLDWEAAQQKLIKGRTNSTRNMRNQYLLAQHVKCSCGYRMHGRSVAMRGYHYLIYRCNAQPKDYAVTRCKSPTYAGPTTDAVVWDWIYNTLLDPESLAKGIEAMFTQTAQERQELQHQKGILEAALKEREAKLARALELYLEDHLDKGTYLRIKHDTEEEQAGISERLEQLNNRLMNLGLSQSQVENLQAFAAPIRQELDTASFEDKRYIIDLLKVEAILYVEDGLKKVHVKCALPNTAADFPIVSTPQAWS